MEISELMQRDLFDVIKDKEIPLSLKDKLSIVYQIAGLLHQNALQRRPSRQCKC